MYIHTYIMYTYIYIYVYSRVLALGSNVVRVDVGLGAVVWKLHLDDAEPDLGDNRVEPEWPERLRRGSLGFRV